MRVFLKSTFLDKNKKIPKKRNDSENMRKLNKSLCFRCTEDQRTWVNEYVQAQGMTFQQWLATVLESLGMPSSDSEQNQSLDGFEQMSLYDVIEKESN